MNNETDRFILHIHKFAMGVICYKKREVFLLKQVLHYDHQGILQTAEAHDKILLKNHFPKEAKRLVKISLLLLLVLHSKSWLNGDK